MHSTPSSPSTDSNGRLKDILAEKEPLLTKISDKLRDKVCIYVQSLWISSIQGMASISGVAAKVFEKIRGWTRMQATD